MEFFLERIARSVHEEFGNDLNHHCLVFPNRRSGLYFMKYLASQIAAPVWSPEIYTVGDLFRSYSPLQAASQELLLFELYRIYRRLRKSPESFDEFYFWGDMLINDFDDVDKYMIDARSLFRNVSDLRNIDQQFGDLTVEQIEIIKKFWINFDPGRTTPEKSGFVGIWSILSDLYSEFRLSLRNQNMAYEGMIFRDIAEKFVVDPSPDPGWYMLHFIGFNALNKCEEVLMKKFRQAGKARFYWDYDNSFIREGKLNSAGFFMRDNLKEFGNNMPGDWQYDTLLSAGQEGIRRRVINTPSDVAQVKLVSGLLKQLPDLNAENAHHTAVVLADENLLMPLLTSLPAGQGDINITMGYPLRHTIVYTLVRNLMELQRNAGGTYHRPRFAFRDVLNILRHPLTGCILDDNAERLIHEITETNLLWVPSARFAGSEHLAGIFTRPDSALMLSGYFKSVLTLLASENAGNVSDEMDTMPGNIVNEFIYRIILSINRVETILVKGEITFTPDTYMRILDRMLSMHSVPFSGEPLSGIQVMGILETRTLDFNNLIILSVNEGILPSVSTGSSFIPFNLREAFGLPSVNHQESVYAYHFYRLLHRASNVTFIYNSNSDGLRTGEMSRFLLQMKYNDKQKPDFLDLNTEIRSHRSVKEIIERTEEHIALLRSRFLDNGNKKVLSPSAINTWLACGMKFYYRYVNGLKEPESVSGEIDPRILGEILHEVMKDVYSTYTGKIVTAEIIDGIVSNREAAAARISSALNRKFSGEDDRPVGGTEYIIRDVLLTYVMKILKADREIAPFTILGLETWLTFPVPVSLNGHETSVITGGIADRIDVSGGRVRIVDYKTGSVAEKINSVGDLFEPDRKKDFDGWLQTMIYCEAYLYNNSGGVVRPSVYRVRKLGSSGGWDKLSIKTDARNSILLEDYGSVREELRINLKAVVEDILGPEKPFVMTRDIHGKCAWCEYRGLCLR